MKPNLTDISRAELRRRREAGETIDGLAAAYGISPSTAWRCCRGVTPRVPSAGVVQAAIAASASAYGVTVAAMLARRPHTRWRDPSPRALATAALVLRVHLGLGHWLIGPLLSRKPRATRVALRDGRRRWPEIVEVARRIAEGLGAAPAAVALDVEHQEASAA